MFVSTVTADVFGTQCYVVAPAEGERCLIVDPGVGVVPRLAALLERHRLTPAAVLLTHGHLDHTFAVTPLSQAHGVAVRIHAQDAYRLRDAYAGLDPQLAALVREQAGPWSAPSDVVTFEGGELRLELADLEILVRHAPGHTEGSVMFEIEGVPEALSSAAGPGEALPTRTLLSGDVLFAGGIGRTDLPGGNDAAMVATLRDVVWPLPDDVLVLPGHGPATTMGVERRRNPYLIAAHRQAGVS
ncbi:MAG: MBL fold metallo-hydrolase [Kineosporiaceae bacterium]